MKHILFLLLNFVGQQAFSQTENEFGNSQNDTVKSAIETKLKLSFGTITKLEVQKQKDIIAPYSLSLFSLLKKVGASDYTASKYLMPKEIIMENKAKLTIRMPEKYISLDIDKISPEKVISLLKKTKFISLTEINIESPQLKSAL